MKNAQQLASKAKEIKALLATPTLKNLTRAEALSGECDRLEAQIGEAIKSPKPAIKSASPARLAELRAAVGSYSPATVVPQYRSLKHITGPDAELKAYCFGQFLRAALLKKTSARNWCAQNGIAIKSHNEGDNASGGFLVPESVDGPIIENRERYGVFRQAARTIRMTDDVHDTPRRTGALTSYWIGEGETITESTMAFDSIKLVSKKLGALMTSSAELSEDAVIALADEIAFEVGWAFSQREDSCGFIGDGTSTYRGMIGIVNALLNLDSTIGNIAGLQVATGTGYGSAYTSMTLADFEDTQARLPAVFDDPNVAWFMHKTFFHNVALKRASAVGLPTPRENGRYLFLGAPVFFAQVMPFASAVNQVVALYGNLRRSSILGDRRDLALKISEHALFNTGSIMMRATSRFDVNNHSVGNASSVAANRAAGAVVGLVTASS